MNGIFGDMSLYFITLVLTVPIVLFSLSFHEFAHAYTAYRLGDPTAKHMGRLTLNPLKHMDPLGAVCMLLFRVGWANPVPVDPRYFKDSKKGMALVAAMGPLANLLLSFLGAGLYMLAFRFYSLASNALIASLLNLLCLLLYQFHYLNLFLAIFNLIPLPPFDGSRILFLFLNHRQYFAIMKYERTIQLLFLVFFALGYANGFLTLITEPLSELFLWVFSFLIPH